MKDASEAANLIQKHIEKGDVIHVSSHIDADGLAAAGIIGKSLVRLGGTFRLRIAKWVDEKVVEQIAAEKPPLTIFTDSGSGYLDLLSEKLSNNNVIILDHHQTATETPSAFIHVNPHFHGIDGSRDKILISTESMVLVISAGLEWHTSLPRLWTKLTLI